MKSESLADQHCVRIKRDSCRMRDVLAVVLDDGHDDAALLIVVVQSDQDIDLSEIRIHCDGDTVLCELDVVSCR